MRYQVTCLREFSAPLAEPGRLGLRSSRRLGYMSSETRYMTFVDADDRLDPIWLYTKIRQLEAASYSALQSYLREPDTGNSWSKGRNQFFIE